MDFGKALLATRPVPAAALAPWVRAVSGAVFVSFGLGKFIAHAAEVRAFDRYGLPAPGLVTYVIGVLEVVSGAMLIAGLLTRLVALLMAGNMAVAIALSGVIEGEVVPSHPGPAAAGGHAACAVGWTGEARGGLSALQSLIAISSPLSEPISSVPSAASAG
ncbi:MAG: DoxX family protein [Thermoleophilaceae bacterium]